MNHHMVMCQHIEFIYQGKVYSLFKQVIIYIQKLGICWCFWR